MRNLPAFLAVLALGASLGACSNCNGVDPGIPDAGEADGGDETRECSFMNEDCSTRPCCVGSCSVGNVCEQGPVACGEPDAACNNGLDCCTNRCDNGACSSQQCTDNGGACSGNGECCTANCAGGSCAAIAGAGGCRVVGQACGAGTDCCSTNCQGGTCAAQYTCRATSDLCFSDLDCCSNLCSKNDGSAGFCRAPSGGCIQDGLPCSGGTNCCTRVCSDPGTGVTVCLPATGCRMTGNSCTDAQACCGGGSNPNGSVKCEKQVSTDAYGRCDNGQACNPVGNICGAVFPLPGGGTFSVNASQNCCDGKKEVCKLDSSGIPRCYGGGSTQCPNGYTGVAPCCIEEGQICQFKDQCCGGAACVPDAMGILRCSTSSCTPLGTACTPGTDTCCSGDCLPSGEFGNVCQFPGDGGTTTDAGPVCKPNGQTCAAPIDCCSALCTNGVCGPPASCQGTGDVCTATADCCSGLGCVIPSGSTSGTCQPSNCAGSGQSCNGAADCCNGLTCLKANQPVLCDGTGACVCTVVIG